MKKLSLLLCGAAALVAASSCTPTPRPRNLTDFYNNRIEQAKDFSDSIVALDATFLGGAINLQVSEAPAGRVNKSEMLRGMRDVLAADINNPSYIDGMRFGISLIELYAEIANEDSTITKQQFAETLFAAFMVDSVSEAEIMKLKPLYDQSFQRLQQKAKERAQADIINSKAAVQNRMIASSVAEKLQSSPDFKAVGNDGLLMHVVSPGDGEVINPNTPITVSINEIHADSRNTIRNIGSHPVMAGNPRHPVLASVIPFMSMGETAEFFVPYELAYGVEGDSELGVGPCESILVTVTVSPFEPQD